MERLKTKSKIWFDDEILGIMDNGDIVLIPGVRRQPKRVFDMETKTEEAQYLNYWVYHRDKAEGIARKREEEDDWG